VDLVIDADAAGEREAVREGIGGDVTVGVTVDALLTEGVRLVVAVTLAVIVALVLGADVAAAVETEL
jgi:hypothetical protein